MTTTAPPLDDLAVIRARAEAATDGTWRSEAINSSRDCYAVRIPNKQGYAELTKADAEFVAHARADLLGVIALAQRQQELLDAVTLKAQEFVTKPVGSLSSIEQPGFGRGVRAAGREIRDVMNVPGAGAPAPTLLDQQRAALERIESLCANADGTVVTQADGEHVPVHLIRAAATLGAA